MTSILPRVREGGSEQMVGVSEDMATSQVSFPTEIEYEAKSMNRCRGRSRFSTSWRSLQALRPPKSCFPSNFGSREG